MFRHGGLSLLETKGKQFLAALFQRKGILQITYAAELQLDHNTLSGYLNAPNAKLPHALVLQACIDYQDETPLLQSLELVRKEIYSRLESASLEDILGALSDVERAETEARATLIDNIKDNVIDGDELARWESLMAEAASIKSRLTHLVRCKANESKKIHRFASLAATANSKF